MEKKSKEMLVTVDSQWLADNVGALIYNQAKAKIFNVLESQIDPAKIQPVKRITEDIIAGIAREASRVIVDVLGDWEDKVVVTAESDLTPEDEAAARKDFEAFDAVK